MRKRFIYKNYSYKIVRRNLKISFVFKMEPENIYLYPKLIIKNIPKAKIDLNNLVFHLGLIEIPSYWKATCAPEIIIEAGYLNKEQIKWWQDLIMKGMGQFFYENKIDWRKPNFLTIATNTVSHFNYPIVELRWIRDDNFLVPMGGGRDSIVTLEKLKRQEKKINCFVVNPSQAIKNVLRVAGIKNPIVVERKIDPTLLELNKKGYLNGHTPFTAVLSFLSVFCAALFNYKNIAFSNEKSADEGNIRYLGRIVNHQWSKSSEFERKFKNYCQKYLVKNLNYFSYLRKYTELEISKMFAKYPKYFPVFSSCNAGQRTGKKWCCRCPKCLFVYLTLCPYLEKAELLKIFGKDLLNDKKLLPVMKSLIAAPPTGGASLAPLGRGQGSHKPFECVGTYKESKEALNLCLEKN